MKTDLSVKDICSKFWDLEKKFNLLDFEIQDVKVWQFLRMRIYYEIAQKTGVFTLHTSPSAQRKNIFRKIHRLIDSLIFSNPLLDKKPKDIVILTHSRKVKVEGEDVDIYSKYLIDEFKQKNISCEAYERGYDTRLCSQEGRIRKHFEIIEIALNRFQKRKQIIFNEKEAKVIEEINRELNQTFQIKIDLKEEFANGLARFKVSYKIFKKVLKRKNPKQVFVVVSYGFPAPLIKAAKDLMIETIELQHGTFSDYHLGYSFPGRQKLLEYFPEKFWIWNEFWRGMCQMPLKPEHVKIYSFKYFDNECKKFLNIQKKPEQIAVISQGAIGYKLADVFLENISDLAAYKIKYKLHPGEYGSWRNNPSLVKLSEYANVEILADNKLPLYQLLAESKYLIGVFSTAVFEGLDFGCELVLLPLPGIEYMRNLIAQGKAKLVKEGERIVDVIRFNAMEVKERR